MSQPDEWRKLKVDHDGHNNGGFDFLVEVWVDAVEDRCLAKGPHPATVLFYSFETPRDARGNISWEMVETIISRRITWYQETKPNQWNRWWGENGEYAKMGDRY